ncbi:MAG: PRD domain-containing protein [Clostridiales bacterium]|nr:PRD domain-containing protein [Clostridiales bacterium]
MKIEKVLNNNVAVILDETGQEVIVMGRGIAFQKKRGDSIQTDNVNKVFTLQNKEINNRFKELVSSIPIKYILISEKIIESSKDILDIEINDSIYVTLTDHISGAIDRYEQGIALKHALFWDIQHYYHNEFSVGKKALRIIENELNIKLVEDEAAFIALHFVNAEINGNMTQVQGIVKLVQEISNIVKYHFQIEYQTKSMVYYSFINHLKGLAQRIFMEQEYCEDVSEILVYYKLRKPESYECAEKVKQFIHKQYGHIITDEEIMCLTMHIGRVFKASYI